MEHFYNWLTDTLISNESSINWNQALNPNDDNIDEYNHAMGMLIDSITPPHLEEYYEQYHDMIENNHDNWVQQIQILTESENWVKLAKLLPEYGY